MKFSVITPCFNSEKFIEETILSVFNQNVLTNSLVEIEYIIVDGGSTDNTLKIIKSLPSKKNFKMIVLSEKDNGMYDALVKGLKISTGDIQSYINAGDFYNLNAFTIVNQIFTNNPKTNWISGNKYIYNIKSEITKCTIPYRYRSNLIQAGVYGRYLPFIQQESLFWRSKLNNYINYEKLKNLKLAGDYFIWVSFSKYAELEIVQTHLGGFKVHPGQLSSTVNTEGANYKEEVLTFIKKINIKDFVNIIQDLIPWLILRFSADFYGHRRGHYRFSDLNEWASNNKNVLYCWACDQASNSGEGQLLNRYASNELKNYKKLFIRNSLNQVILTNNNSNLSKNENYRNKLKLSFYESYIMPFLGILYLWCKYISGKKVCYINFLPLWNIFLFIFLPPGTKLGPITGSIYNQKVNNFESLLRKYFLPLLYKISGKIILNFRGENLIFSTDLLKDYLSSKVKAKSKFNYVFENIKINTYNRSKNIDLIIYNRNYFNKSNELFSKIITKLQEDNFIVYYFGDEIPTPGRNYKNLIKNEKVQEYLNRSKFTIISNENFYSFFCLEAIKNNVNIFYNIKQKVNIDFLKKSKKLIQLDYSDDMKVINRIKKEITNFDMYNYPYSKT